MADENTNTHTDPGRPNPRAGDHGLSLANTRAGQLLLRRYLILSILGQGGMGTVFRVRDELTGIDLALKALPPSLALNFSEMKTVRENFRLVHDLHHPHIANLNTLEQDPESGAYFLLMECVVGEDLSAYRNRHAGKQPLTFWLPMLRQVSDALEYAHRRKIIHRDIKPSNIFITDDGEIKLLDFGIASQTHTTMHETEEKPGVVSGTASYMAPEQWLGIPQGPEADQYALAVTIYQLVAGHCPFVSDVVTALREAVLQEEPLKPNSLSNKNWKVLKKALAKNPEERYRSCDIFMTALERSCGMHKTSRLPGMIAFITVALFAILSIGIWWFNNDQDPLVVSTPPPVTITSGDIPPIATEQEVAPPLEPKSALPETIPKKVDPAIKASALAAQEKVRSARELAIASQVTEYAPKAWQAAEEKRGMGDAAVRFKMYAEATAPFSESLQLYASAQKEAEAEAARRSQQREDELTTWRNEQRTMLITELRKVQQAMSSADNVRNEAPDVWNEITKDLRQSSALVQKEKFQEAYGSLKNVLIRLESVQLYLQSQARKPPPAVAILKPADAPAPFGIATIHATPPAGFTGATTFELLQNGKSMGTVDLPYGPITLPAGPHNFQLRGHPSLADSEVRLLNLKPGTDQALEVPVTWRPSSIEIDVVPSDAHLAIARGDERPAEIEGLHHPVMANETYTLTATAPGYRNATQRILVKPGNTRTIHLTLRKNPKIMVRP